MMSKIIDSIDAEIKRLQNARAMLSEVESIAPTTAAGKRGRPKGSINKLASKPRVKRLMTDEGRARIAAAQKKRHAEKRKAAKASDQTERAGPSIEEIGCCVVDEYPMVEFNGSDSIWCKAATLSAD